MRRLLASAGLLMGAGAAAFSWGLVEAHRFTVRRCTLPVLPSDAEPIRVLHVSDFHLLERQHDKARFIASLTELEPDLVVDTGDNIASAGAIDAVTDALGPLLDVPGVYIFGSNDYQAPHWKNPLRYVIRGRSEAVADDVAPVLPTERLDERLAARGWINLTHRRAQLTIRGTRIEFRGTDDAHHDRDDYSTVAGAPAPDVDLAVGVTHAPYLRLLDAMTRDDVDVIFAGHTHGGQVCVPLLGALTTNCDLDPARVQGPSEHTVDGRTARLHVSGGLGTSPYAPFRFACPPTVTLVTLAPGG